MRVNHVASHWPVMMQLSQRPQEIRVTRWNLGRRSREAPRYESLYLSLLMRDIAVLPCWHDPEVLAGFGSFLGSS